MIFACVMVDNKHKQIVIDAIYALNGDVDRVMMSRNLTIIHVFILFKLQDIHLFTEELLHMMKNNIIEMYTVSLDEL